MNFNSILYEPFFYFLALFFVKNASLEAKSNASAISIFATFATNFWLNIKSRYYMDHSRLPIDFNFQECFFDWYFYAQGCSYHMMMFDKIKNQKISGLMLVILKELLARFPINLVIVQVWLHFRHNNCCKRHGYLD